MQFCTMYVCYVNTKLLTKILLYKHTLRCFANVFQKKLIYKGRVTRIHISEILYSVIFPKYYSCVSLIISNCFFAATQSKHWVKNLSLYNLMAAKMIDELEIAYMSFCASYSVIMELDTKKKSRRKIWTREWLLKRNERGAYNGISNELRLNEF